MKIQYTANLQRDFGSDLLSQVGNDISGGIGSAINQGMGLLFQGEQNQNQINQQQKLTDIQLNANEALSKYNYGQQLQMWGATNYPAQVQQLDAAGLNPALLYGKGGGGGTTVGSPSGGIGMGIATPPPNLAQTAQGAIQAQEAAADIKLKDAQANQLNAQTPQTADLMQAQIASINQNVNNAKAQEMLTDAQTQTQKLTNSLQGATLDDQIATIQATANKIEQEAQIAVRNNYIDQNTMDNKIKTIQGVMIGTFLQNQLTAAQTTQAKTGVQLTQTQITQITNNIAQSWQQIGINKQNANTQEGQLKLQQLIKDVPDSQSLILQSLTKLVQGLIVM